MDAAKNLVNTRENRKNTKPTRKLPKPVGSIRINAYKIQITWIWVNFNRDSSRWKTELVKHQKGRRGKIGKINIVVVMWSVTQSVQGREGKMPSFRIESFLKRDYYKDRPIVQLRDFEVVGYYSRASRDENNESTWDLPKLPYYNPPPLSDWHKVDFDLNLNYEERDERIKERKECNSYMTLKMDNFLHWIVNHLTKIEAQPAEEKK